MYYIPRIIIFTSNLHSKCNSTNQVLAVIFYLHNSKSLNNINICSVHLKRHKNEAELAEDVAQLWILLILKTLEEIAIEGRESPLPFSL